MQTKQCSMISFTKSKKIIIVLLEVENRHVHVHDGVQVEAIAQQMLYRQKPVQLFNQPHAQWNE